MFRLDKHLIFIHKVIMKKINPLFIIPLFLQACLPTLGVNSELLPSEQVNPICTTQKLVCPRKEIISISKTNDIKNNLTILSEQIVQNDVINNEISFFLFFSLLFLVIVNYGLKKSYSYLYSHIKSFVLPCKYSLSYIELFNTNKKNNSFNQFFKHYISSMSLK